MNSYSSMIFRGIEGNKRYRRYIFFIVSALFSTFIVLSLEQVCVFSVHVDGVDVWVGRYLCVELIFTHSVELKHVIESYTSCGCSICLANATWILYGAGAPSRVGDLTGVRIIGSRVTFNLRYMPNSTLKLCDGVVLRGSIVEIRAEHRPLIFVVFHSIARKLFTWNSS